MNSDSSDIDNLRDRCIAQLSRHPRRATKAWLKQLADSKYAQLDLDLYGQGPLPAALEQRVSTLLGKPSARFMPKGTIAQQIALLVHAQRTGNDKVAIHRQSHMAMDECDAVEALAGLDVTKVGRPGEALTLDDFTALEPDLGAIVLELPVRRAGFCLAPWEELVRLTQWARDRGMVVHMDGARIWESAPYYGKSLAEIADLADSVYVSLYKGLGAMGGCVLAGESDLIDKTDVWQSRFGGYLYTAAPYLIGGLEGLDRYLDKMPTYHAAACELAGLLGQNSDLSVYPDPPHTNGFQIRFPCSPDTLWARCLSLAEQQQVWLFDSVSPWEAGAMAEVHVGDATLARPLDFWSHTIQQLLHR